MIEADTQRPWRPQTKTSLSPGVSVALSVLVPVYNEEDAITATLDTIRSTLDAAGEKYELIVVDDGSTDRTEEVLGDYLETRPGSIRTIQHSSNSGYGSALKTGIRAAVGELIVITDADGTYPIDRIPDLVAALRGKDVAMVVGARNGKQVEYSSIRRIPKVFLKAYIDWLARTDVPDFNSGLRVFRRDIAERFFGIFPNGFSFTTTITLACLTNRYPVVFVPINYSERVGNSKIQPVRDTLRFMQLIVRTGMYFAPLRVLGPVSAILFLMAMVSFGIDVAHWNMTQSTILLFMFSLQLGVFALLADMIDKRMPK